MKALRYLILVVLPMLVSGSSVASPQSAASPQPVAAHPVSLQAPDGGDFLICILECAACGAAPETIIPCLAWLNCLRQPWGAATVAAVTEQSHWAAAAAQAAAGGQSVELAIFENAAASAPGHSWALGWNEATRELSINNTGSSLDTAIVIAFTDSCRSVIPLPMSAAQTLVPVPAGGTVVEVLPASSIGRNLVGCSTWSTTGFGRNGDGLRVMRITEMPLVSPWQEIALVLALIVTGALFVRRQREAA
jgi:hypothetical protein